MRGAVRADRRGNLAGIALVVLEPERGDAEREGIGGEAAPRHQNPETLRGGGGTDHEEQAMPRRRHVGEDAAAQVRSRDATRNRDAAELGVKVDRHAVGGDHPGALVGSPEIGVTRQVDDVIEVGGGDDPRPLAGGDAGLGDAA